MGRMPKRFNIGARYDTRRVRELLAAGTITLHDMRTMYRRHQSGDWGEVEDWDFDQNEESVNDNGYLLSKYTVKGIQFAVTTCDRTATGATTTIELWEEINDGKPVASIRQSYR